MKSNGLLKWLLIPVILLAVFVGVRLFSSSERSSPTPSANTTRANQLTAGEVKTLGVEGDTAHDTVATLVAQVKQLRQELQTAVSDNKQRKAENEQLRLRDGAIDQRIQNALNSERDRWRQNREQVSGDQQQTRSLVQELQRKLDTLGNKPDQGALPVGLGLQDGDSAGFDERIRWLEPQDARPPDTKTTTARFSTSAGERRFPTSFDTAAEQPESRSESVDDSTAAAGGRQATSSSLMPIYTVPANATLTGSIAMTALVGRVPIDGTVNDPYPFKVLIGSDNLTANGIELPDVAGAVVSGTASGDWTLSCVRGQVRSITFVFNDGTIRTVSPSTSRGGDAASSTERDLGWISDPYGIPCVSGKRLSNARQYLSSQMLITAAGAGAASLIPRGSSNYSFVSGANGSLGTVGISGNEAMGRILGGGVQEMSQWVNKLYGQAFAAVYVRPAARVAVHIEQPLELDYDTKGRKVNHWTGDVHAPELD